MPQYSSKYYDPVKAHQYYEEHKQLKGKKPSTATLNETGKKAATYVKEQITKEKNEALETESKNYSNRIFQQTSDAKARITSLQKKFSKLSRAQKKILGPKIQKELQKIQENINRKREILKNEYEKNRKSINENYSNKYDSEVEKMNQDSSMVKQQSTTKSNTTTKTTKKSTSKKSSNAKKSVEEQIAERRKEARELMAKKKK